MKQSKPTRHFHFSLKQLFWSVTFSSLGLMVCSIGLSKKSVLLERVKDLPDVLLWPVSICILVAPGPLFGAAVGSLGSTVKVGAFFGLITWLVFIGIYAYLQL